MNTLPMETIDAFRDHGKVADTLTQGISEANKVMEDLKKLGINIDEITQKLEDEGIGKFNDAYEKLLKSIENQIKK